METLPDRARAPLIRKPGRQSVGQRMLFGTLAALGWTIWLSLWLPIATALLWLSGVWHASEKFLELPGGSDLFFITALATVSGFVILAWAFYNRYRFRGPDRRSRAEEISLKEIQGKSGLDPVSCRNLAQGTRVTIFFGPGGVPAKVTDRSPFADLPSDAGKGD